MENRMKVIEGGKLTRKRVTMVDPPSGWLYDFPKPLPEGFSFENDSIRKWFLDNGYPEKDIGLALKYSRYWETFV